MSGNLKINGVAVKPPQEFSVGLQDIHADSSGRNANGDMVIDIIAAKVKIELKWGPLSDIEISTILKSIDSPFFSIEYPDPKVGGQITKTFYKGDRTTPSYSWNDKFKQVKWNGLVVNFIER